jgi:hypothetical protein
MGSTNIIVPDLHVVHQKLDYLIKSQKVILAVIKEIQKEGKVMTQELVDLQAAVAENTSLDDSIIELVNGLAAQIELLKDDPAAMAKMASDLRAKSAALSAAVQAHTTPAEPTPSV